MSEEFIPDCFNFETFNAVSIGSQTLLGFNNCFSVRLDNKDYVNIVNFYLETLEKLLKEKLIEWPIKVSILGGKIGVIHDPRIDREFYNVRFCETCCPMDLLPMPQRLANSRLIQAGKLSYKKCPANPELGFPEMIISSQTIEIKGNSLSNWVYKNVNSR